MNNHPIELEVQRSKDGNPIPVEVFEDDLSGKARCILLAALGKPRQMEGRTNKDWLLAKTGLSDASWRIVRRELMQKGWLIHQRINHGGRRGWEHKLHFLRSPTIL